eukprot:7381620-Prymnesium_polylepis.1
MATLVGVIPARERWIRSDATSRRSPGRERENRHNLTGANSRLQKLWAASKEALITATSTRELGQSWPDTRNSSAAHSMTVVRCTLVNRSRVQTR